MSLKKKIALSFFISVFIIALLAIFEYINFIGIKKEIRRLELTDTIRSKSLQLRRHEKNFFLYPLKTKEESEAIHKYLIELNGILNSSLLIGRENGLSDLRSCVKEYEYRFNIIESAAKDLSKEFERIKTSHVKFNNLFPLVESTLIEHPLQGSELLQKFFLMPSGSRLVLALRELDAQINILRKEGENILFISKELDKRAREKVENTIYISQIAILLVTPLVFIIGVGTIFFFNRDVVNRLKVLTGVVERTGRGNFSKVALVRGNSRDEVGTLIQKFNTMEEQLAQREKELEIKNKELLQNKKLAAIGTLASGVAHELNNPLNNIYISSQVLEREIDDTSSQNLREVVQDIRGQTLRVKKIVGDLLEFARGREPQFRKIELNTLITDVYNQICKSVNLEKIKFVLDSRPNEMFICADPEQMERVFINLFTNAIDAMSGEGNLIVRTGQYDNLVEIKVSDSGRGMPVETAEKVFEPFFTTKDRGTGLGLAIVFNIIKKHDGEITIKSEEGKGTTFSIKLPKMRICDDF
ncbi:MAG: ATP-binding protein [Nitrospirota bacterium]